MKASLEFHKGFEQMLQRYQELGGQAEEAVKECIEAGQKMLYGEYYDGLARHDDTGAALDSLEIDPVVQDGNFFYGKVGSSAKKNRSGFYHALWQEQGARTRKGVVTFAADPWKRPADDQIRVKYTKICREIMKRRMSR